MSSLKIEGGQINKEREVFSLVWCYDGFDIFRQININQKHYVLFHGRDDEHEQRRQGDRWRHIYHRY